MPAARNGNTTAARIAPIVRLRALRTAGALQVCLCLPSGAMLVWLAVWRFATLNFSASAITGPAVAYSWAFVALCTTCAGLALLWIGLRWLLYAVWPGAMGVTVTTTEVKIALGPFGSRRLPLSEWTATYRFEKADEEQSTPEDFMDPDEEVATHLPLIQHRTYPLTLNRVLEKYIAGNPNEHLERLTPLVKLLRDQP